MYVKVKRQKTTIFLLVELADTVASVKQKLEELVQQVRAARRSRRHDDNTCLRTALALASAARMAWPGDAHTSLLTLCLSHATA